MCKAFVVSAILISLLAAVLTIPGAVGEAPSVGWQKTYGGAGSDMTWSMIQTADGGYALAGESQVGTSGVFYAWLVKTDIYGNASWNQTFEGTFRSVVQTADGGYAIAGIFNNDFLLVKTDSNGNGLWRRTYDPVKSPENRYTSVARDYAWSVVQTSDGGYALAGMTNNNPFEGEDDDVWLVKTDVNGTAVWNQTYAGPDVDYAYDVVQTSDGGYAIGGGTEISGKQMEFWLIKTDASGNALWNKTYGRADTDWLYSMIQTSDGGFALAGGYAYGVSAYGGWLVKTDADGNEQWNKTYGGTFLSLSQTVDGGYALAGVISDQGAGGSDSWFVKTDANGNEEWNMTYGGPGEDRAFSVVQAADGGYALSGPTESYGAGSRDFWLIKTDEFGVVPEFPSYLLALLILPLLAGTLYVKKELLKRQQNSAFDN